MFINVNDYNRRKPEPYSIKAMISRELSTDPYSPNQEADRLDVLETLVTNLLERLHQNATISNKDITQIMPSNLWEIHNP